MALVVENGSGVAGANSYVSVTAARAYCSARGLTLPASDPAVEVLLTKALDYVESFRDEFQGEKVDAGQSLQWPRANVTLDGFDLASDVVPDLVAKAQAQLAYDASQQELRPVGIGQEVVRKKVEGAVEIEYHPMGNTNVQPIFNVARALLAPLLLSQGDFLRTVRV